jgi:hypothetical protein
MGTNERTICRRTSRYDIGGAPARPRSTESERTSQIDPFRGRRDR